MNGCPVQNFGKSEKWQGFDLIFGKSKLISQEIGLIFSEDECQIPIGKFVEGPIKAIFQKKFSNFVKLKKKITL